MKKIDNTLYITRDDFNDMMAIESEGDLYPSEQLLLGIFRIGLFTHNMKPDDIAQITRIVIEPSGEEKT